MNISIIIVNWNSAVYTEACIASLHAAIRKLTYEIVVVDNGSTDDSVRKLEARDDVIFVSSPSNLGFARANNLGYEHSSGEVLLFLNPDTQVIGTALETMHGALVSSERIGITGCRLLNSDCSLQTSCVLPFPTILNQLTDVEALKIRFPKLFIWGISPLFTDKVQLAKVDAVSGACLMIRRSLFEAVDGFSGEYFMYCEDVDLCRKVARVGYDTMYVSDARVVHHGGQSSKKARESSFADVVGHEAIRIFLAKWRGTLYARLYTQSMFAAALLRLALLGIVSMTRMSNEPSRTAASRRKWRGILSWSMGREHWARELGRTSSPVTSSHPTTA